jgi:peroxiredoxin
MPQLDGLYTHFQSQGLVVLSISDEDAFKVNSFIAPAGYHPIVLLDPGGVVHKQFHIEGIPRTFVFNREGKLVAVAIDQRTMRQFLMMLSKTDLHP